MAGGPDSTKILIGLAGGILLGLFVGDHAAVLQWAADGYVKLLQMTVLPYVTLSIIAGLGALKMADARALAVRAGAVLAGIWLLALTFALLVPLTFPRVENAAFFSSSLVEPPAPFDFVSLYIPANPFYSLANNIVPAVVLFSVIVGVALIGVPGKEAMLAPLAIAITALARATRAVVRLTPYGLFAIAATTAGTLSLEQLGRLQLYLVAYAVVALLFALWVLPGLVAALTPIRVRDIFAVTRNALITAFVAGDLFIVLPVLIASSQTLIGAAGLASPPESDLPEVIVPASFNFPHAGKLLSISFVLFAGWFADAAGLTHLLPATGAYRAGHVLRQPQRRGAVPARTLPDPIRHLSAVSRERRDQLAFRDAGRRRPHVDDRVARHLRDDQRPAVGTAAHHPLRGRDHDAHRGDNRRASRAVCQRAGATLHKGPGARRHAVAASSGRRGRET